MRIVPRDTQPLRNKDGFTPFSVWLNERGQSGELSAKRYRFAYCDQDGYFIADRKPFFYAFLVEVKSNGSGTMGLSQKTSLHVQHAVHYLADNQPFQAKFWGRRHKEERVYKFLGVHLLEMDGQSPGDSEHILWDSRWELEESGLCEILRFERDARDPDRLLSLDDAEVQSWYEQEYGRMAE